MTKALLKVTAQAGAIPSSKPGPLSAPITPGSKILTYLSPGRG